MNELKICKHSNGHGWCFLYESYCLEGPCEKEELVEYATVIRCKDCYFVNCYDELLPRYECTRMLGSIQVKADDFCSYGKRKEKNNEN